MTRKFLVVAVCCLAWSIPEVLAYADPSANKAIVAHVEHDICPKLAGGLLTGLPDFRFSDDGAPHVVLIVSDDHYHADKTLPAFGHLLTERYNFHCTVTHGHGKADIPGLEVLATADAVVLYVRRLALPKQQLEMIRAYIEAGKPLLALRTANHAFSVRGDAPPESAQWPEFDRDVLGGNYENHGQKPSEISIVPSAANHPILAGIEPPHWTSTGTLYFVSPIDRQAVVLLKGTSEGRTEPVAWTRQYKGGRVFYTSLGHWDDFASPQFVTMLINAICWAVDRPREVSKRCHP